tara:strand:- start:137 stop:850 length:714 start_codon:yes stop_codon:yes gene_type:complete
MNNYKIFIPLICYNRNCHTDYMMSILSLVSYFHKSNTDAVFYPIFFESLISRGRNAAVAEFLRSDATHILFIDSDITFEPEDVQKLIDSNKEVICSPYPKKYIKLENANQENKEIVDFAVGGKFIKVDKNIYEIDSVATGFLLIKRQVFEKILMFNKNLTYINDIDGYGLGNKTWDFFKVGINPKTGTYDSEDWGFCNLWRNIGEKIYARSDIKLTHWGWYGFKGNFDKWLNTAKKI